MEEKDPQYVELKDCASQMQTTAVAIAKLETVIEESSKHTQEMIKVLGIVVTIISIAAAILTKVL